MLKCISSNIDTIFCGMLETKRLEVIYLSFGYYIINFDTVISYICYILVHKYKVQKIFLTPLRSINRLNALSFSATGKSCASVVLELSAAKSNVLLSVDILAEMTFLVVDASVDDVVVDRVRFFWKI